MAVNPKAGDVVDLSAVSAYEAAYDRVNVDDYYSVRCVAWQRVTDLLAETEATNG
jgi:hypothetical protein